MFEVEREEKRISATKRKRRGVFRTLLDLRKERKKKDEKGETESVLCANPKYVSSATATKRGGGRRE